MLFLIDFADAHVGVKEYHRAVNYYTQAEKLLTRKVYPTLDGSSGLSRGGVVASPGMYTPGNNNSTNGRNSIFIQRFQYIIVHNFEL